MERGLHHELHGAGEPLLLVHGTGSSLRLWDPVVERLAARTSVIAVDLPGFGASPPLTPSGPPPTPAGFAAVLAVEIARAFGRSPGFEEHLEAAIPQRFVGGNSIAVAVSVAFGEGPAAPWAPVAPPGAAAAASP